VLLPLFEIIILTICFKAKFVINHEILCGEWLAVVFELAEGQKTFPYVHHTDPAASREKRIKEFH